MSGASLQVNAIHPLFQTNLPGFAAPFFDVSADGSRFLVISSADPNPSDRLGCCSIGDRSWETEADLPDSHPRLARACAVMATWSGSPRR